MKYVYVLLLCLSFSGNLFAQELMDAWDAVDAGREALLEAPAPPDGYAQSTEQLLSGWEAVDRGRAMERDHWQSTGYVPPTTANGWYQNPWDVVIWNAPPVYYYYPAWQPRRTTIAHLRLPPGYVYGSTEAYNRRLAQIAAREREQEVEPTTTIQDGEESVSSTQPPPVPEQVAAVKVLPSQSEQSPDTTATLKLKTEGTETEATFSTQEQGEMLQKLSAQHFTAEEQRKKEQETRNKIALTLVISGIFSIPLLLIIVYSSNKIIEGIKEIKRLDIERFREANQLLSENDS